MLDSNSPPVSSRSEDSDQNILTSTSDDAAKIQASVLKTIGKPGFYQYLLLPTIWWCNIVTVSNDSFMVYGEYKPSKCVNITNSHSFVNCSDNVFKGFYEEWDLGGSYDYIPPLMATLQLAGSLVGALVGGPCSDSFGRYPVMVISLLTQMTIGIISYWSPSWQVMMGLRVLIGIACGSYFSCGVVYIMEVVSSDYRLAFEASIDGINSVGFIWLSFLAWQLENWELLSVVQNVVLIPFLIILMFMEETPHWLIQAGKEEKANKVIAKIARWNGCQDSIQFVPISPRIKQSAADSPKFGYLQLFKTRTLSKYTLVMCFSFFVTGTVGYGLIFNVGNLIGNIFLNFAVLGFVNVPSAVFVCLFGHFFGLRRRLAHQIALNGVWICLLVVTFLFAFGAQERLYILTDAASYLGSMFSVPLWTVSALYSVELFPTMVRNMANGAGNVAVKTGGMLAPQIIYSMKYWTPLPFLILVIVAMINVVLSFFFLPETKGLPLPDTEPPKRHQHRGKRSGNKYSENDEEKF